jgi:hypothetical protein
VKVYSTSLFGEGDKYAQYLPAFVIAACNLFPRKEGWQIRIHTDDKFLETKMGAVLLCLFGSELVEMRVREPAPLTKAMLWRMAPVWEPWVTHVFCRDIDAPPMPRDRVVCEQFIKSQAAIGTCHDNEAHVGVMGGLCHFDTQRFIAQTGIKSLDELYRRYSWMKWGQHGVDQDALNKLVSETPNLTLLEHRYAGWREGRPGTTDREAGIYKCQAWSTRTPDASHLTGSAAPLADALGAHLGCAGYDHQKAMAFWEEHGDPAITRIVHSCQAFD